jgi:predicted transcriptional regulator
MDSSALARYLFEMASEERLAILESITAKPLKHAQLTRRLKMTGSETTRHLNRLQSAGMVRRNPRGEYEATRLAALGLRGLSFFRFLTTQREFLEAHDVLGLPPEFVERLGALREGTFIAGTYEVVGTQVKYLRTVRRRCWVLSEQAFEQAIPILREKAVAGADVRVIRNRAAFERTIPVLGAVERNYPVRLLSETRIFLAVLDDTAGVSFPALDGKVDMATMILLESPEGYQWAEDLFLQFWNRAGEWLGPSTSTR